MEKIDTQIEEILLYFDETDITVEDPPDFGDYWILVKTLNVELDVNDLKHLLLRSDFKYLQVKNNEDGDPLINLIFVRR